MHLEYQQIDKRQGYSYKFKLKKNTSQDNKKDVEVILFWKIDSVLNKNYFIIIGITMELIYWSFRSSLMSVCKTERGISR